MLGALASSMATQDVDLLLLRRALLLCQDTDCGVRQVKQDSYHSGLSFSAKSAFLARRRKCSSGNIHVRLLCAGDGVILACLHPLP